MPSKTVKQHNLMALVAHSLEASKKYGISQKVAREFLAADKRKKEKKS